MHGPIIQFPFDPTGELDDNLYLELCNMKGVIYLFVKTDEGERLPITFITYGAMNSFIRDMLNHPGKYYTYYEGFILVEQIDMETMNRALESAWIRGCFKKDE